VRILVHTLYFPPEVGGLESHVHFLCKGLVERGHTVRVVTSRSVPGVPTYEETGGIEVWRTWFPARNPAGWAAHSLASMGRTLALAKESDLFHAQAFSSVLPGALARARAGIPMVATLHTSHFLRRASRPLWRPFLSRMVKTPDYTLASSEEIARVAEALAPGLSVEAVTNGVDPGFFRRVPPTLPPSEVPRILVPRRLFEKNGVEYFIRSLPLILAEVEVEAVLVGDGPERQRLEELTRSLRLEDRVEFVGKVSHEEMPGLLSSGCLAVIPSLVEATSVAALEAMACELPVAASSVGGLPEIVDGSVGALFQPANPEELAQTVVKLLLDPHLAGKGAEARRRVVEQWSNERLVDRHLEIYEALLGGRAKEEWWPTEA
jgi:glycosyltransferase involved in cell wall biosynthesis